MPIGGEVLLVGEYTVTWNSVALGLFQGEDGYPTLVPMPRSKPINRTSKYGFTKIDSIHLGTDYTLEMVCMEASKAYSLSALSPLWPFGLLGALGIIGLLKYGLALPLVLTAVAGTSAAAAPATMTSAKAVLADDFQSKIVFGPDLRIVPLKFDLLLASQAGPITGHFSAT